MEVSRGPSFCLISPSEEVTLTLGKRDKTSLDASSYKGILLVGGTGVRPSHRGLSKGPL
jgi:hypothetical protein